MPVTYFWSLGRSREYETEVAASSLVKSHSRVDSTSTGSERVVLYLSTGGDLDASFCWSQHTKMGTFEGIRHKNDVSERLETLVTSSMQQA